MKVVDLIKAILSVSVVVVIVAAMMFTAAQPTPARQHERFDPEFTQIILESLDRGWIETADLPQILSLEGGGPYGGGEISREVSPSR